MVCSTPSFRASLIFNVLTLVKCGTGRVPGLLPMSPLGGAAGEAEDASELGLDRGGVGCRPPQPIPQHPVRAEPASVAVVQQDGLLDVAQVAEQDADVHIQSGATGFEPHQVGEL